MKKSWSHLINFYTQQFADDPEIRLAIEDKLAEVLSKIYDDAMANNTTPEDAKELILSMVSADDFFAKAPFNALIKKFNRRKKIRKIIKLAIVPLLILGIFLATDLRMIESLVTLKYLDRMSSASLLFPKFIDYEKLFHSINEYRLRTLLPADKEFVTQYISHKRNNPEWPKNAYYRDLNNRIYTAYYAQNLAIECFSAQKTEHPSSSYPSKDIKTIRAEFDNVLKNGRRIDPDNALYDHLEVYVLLSTALLQESKRVVLPDKDNRSHYKCDYNYKILDREAFDQAMKIYLQSLDKPFHKTYCIDMANDVLELNKPEKDYLGTLQKENILASTPLLYLMIYREINRVILFYGETLAKENNPVESEKYLKSWSRLIPQLMKNNELFFIDVLVYYALVNSYLEPAQKRGDKEDINKLLQAQAIIKDFKAQKDPNIVSLKKYGGFLAARTIPGLRIEIPIEYFAAERKASYILLDLLTLVLCALVLTISIIHNAISIWISYLRGNRGFLIFMSGMSYLRILLYGIVLPLGLWYIYTRIDCLGGRGFSIFENLWRFSLGEFFLAVLWIIIFSVVCSFELKKYATKYGAAEGKFSKATVCYNLIILSIGLLLFVGTILRPALNLESKYYIAHDQMFINDVHFSYFEKQITLNLADKLLKSVAK